MKLTKNFSVKMTDQICTIFSPCTLKTPLSHTKGIENIKTQNNRENGKKAISVSSYKIRCHGLMKQGRGSKNLECAWKVIQPKGDLQYIIKYQHLKYQKY